jgi:hypothetical protein
MLWLLLAGLGLATASELVKLRKAGKLPDLSDVDFVMIYKKKFAGSDAAVIEERRFIAKVLGLPFQRLSPEHSFDELSKYAGFVGDYELGMSELGDKIDVLCGRAAIQRPYPFPVTVGEFIYEIVKAKEKLSKDEL